MYERTSHTTIHAASITSEHAALNLPEHFLDDHDLLSPSIGNRIAELCGDDGAQAVYASLHANSPEESKIFQIARERLGLEFTTVSELNSAGASFCGLFWDSEENFIVVSFKGTNPIDYMEWNTDFTVNMRKAGQWLSGFGRGQCFIESVYSEIISKIGNPAFPCLPTVGHV